MMADASEILDENVPNILGIDGMMVKGRVTPRTRAHIVYIDYYNTNYYYYHVVSYQAT